MNISSENEREKFRLMTGSLLCWNLIKTVCEIKPYCSSKGQLSILKINVNFCFLWMAKHLAVKYNPLWTASTFLTHPSSYLSCDLSQEVVSNISTWGGTSLPWGWWSTGAGCPERRCTLHLWSHSKISWTLSCAVCSRWTSSGRDVGLNDLQMSLPAPIILWLLLHTDLSCACTQCPPKCTPVYTFEEVFVPAVRWLEGGLLSAPRALWKWVSLWVLHANNPALSGS